MTLPALVALLGLVELTGAEDFWVRELATNALDAAGSCVDTRPALEAGMRHGDPEVRARCRRLHAAYHSILLPYWPRLEMVGEVGRREDYERHCEDWGVSHWTCGLSHTSYTHEALHRDDSARRAASQMWAYRLMEKGMSRQGAESIFREALARERRLGLRPVEAP